MKTVQMIALSEQFIWKGREGVPVEEFHLSIYWERSAVKQEHASAEYPKRKNPQLKTDIAIEKLRRKSGSTQMSPSITFVSQKFPIS